MPAQQSQDGPHAARPRARKTPKPTLMKSYAAVSDDDLQGIVGKIRSITRSAEARRSSPAVGAREAEAASGPIDQSVDHPVDQSSGQSTNQSTTWPIERSHGRSHDRPDEWSIERPNDTSHGIEAGAAPRNPIVFNLNQAILYHCIYRLEGRASSLQRISQITGISAFTLKHCLRKLRQEGAIAYHGRQNAGGRIGFGATALPCVMVLRGDEHQLLQRLEEIRFERLPIARAVDPARTAIGDDNGLMNGPITGLLDGPMEAGLCSSSGKKLLLQELVLEDAFRNLNPDSLLPHLEGIGTVAELQDFLDMANACVAAARRNRLADPESQRLPDRSIAGRVHQPARGLQEPPHPGAGKTQPASGGRARGNPAPEGERGRAGGGAFQGQAVPVRPATIGRRSAKPPEPPQSPQRDAANRNGRDRNPSRLAAGRSERRRRRLDGVRGKGRRHGRVFPRLTMCRDFIQVIGAAVLAAVIMAGMCVLTGLDG